MLDKNHLNNYYKFLPGVVTIAMMLLILYLAYTVLKPFLFVIIIAFIFSVFLSPIYDRLAKDFRNHSLAAGFSLLILILFVLLPMSFILGSIINEATKLIDILQKEPDLVSNFESFITNQIQLYGLPVDVSSINFQNESLGFLRSLVNNIGSTLLYTTTIILNLFFVLIATYFFLTQKDKIRNYLINIGFIPERYFIRFQNRTVELVNGIVRGNLLVILVQIIFGTIGFFIFGLPVPMLLGLLYGLFSLLPGVGAILVWLPVAIVLLFTQGVTTAVLFALWFVISNLINDNFIAPKIIGSQTKLHQLLIMFSVVGGVQQYGLVGIVLGPIIVALSFIVVEIYKELVGSQIHQP